MQEGDGAGMTPSENAISLIVLNEWGVRGKMPFGQRTDERGRILAGVGRVFKHGDKWPSSQEQAMRDLYQDLQSIAGRLSAYGLTQRQFDGLCVWGYYASQRRCESIMGEPWEICRIWRALDDGKPVIAGSYISDWTYLDGRQYKPLVALRKKEVHLFHYGEVLR